jgi:hypothetical protein
MESMNWLLRMVGACLYVTRYDFSSSAINLSITEDCHDVNVTCNVSLAGLADISCPFVICWSLSTATSLLSTKSESMDASASC